MARARQNAATLQLLFCSQLASLPVSLPGAELSIAKVAGNASARSLRSHRMQTGMIVRLLCSPSLHATMTAVASLVDPFILI
ncbi:uncharacterized protein F5Z01DRAFT_468143 [Emericellopsis atlantica]|uniref:Secreted protein n=1 Tax=Emericellopsis atlantica TaxID=2614577 RepID=A0A9P7ZDQ5_9HYPO|nr:uncharacterized protein F5Z01DRAFT_468143 [Emericellopsis atlantica]KAG9249680.1 hypothetical protein F5Z01DRAFT_468143 [Emericellopsis atlantica]